MCVQCLSTQRIIWDMKPPLKGKYNGRLPWESHGLSAGNSVAITDTRFWGGQTTLNSFFSLIRFPFFGLRNKTPSVLCYHHLLFAQTPKVLGKQNKIITKNSEKHQVRQLFEIETRGHDSSASPHFLRENEGQWASGCNKYKSLAWIWQTWSCFSEESLWGDEMRKFWGEHQNRKLRPSSYRICWGTWWRWTSLRCCMQSFALAPGR